MQVELPRKRERSETPLPRQGEPVDPVFGRRHARVGLDTEQATQRGTADRRRPQNQTSINDAEVTSRRNAPSLPSPPRSLLPCCPRSCTAFSCLFALPTPPIREVPPGSFFTRLNIASCNLLSTIRRVVSWHSFPSLSSLKASPFRVPSPLLAAKSPSRASSIRNGVRRGSYATLRASGYADRPARPTAARR